MGAFDSYNSEASALDQLTRSGFLRHLRVRFHARSGTASADLSRSPRLSPYEHAQRKKLLATMLKVIFFSGIALVVVNVCIHAWNIAIALGALCFFCVPAFWLNSRDHYNVAASLILAAILFAANYNLYATGGIRDSGMLVYPLIIIVGSLFFGKSAIPVLTIASAGSLAAFAYFELEGIFLPAPVETDFGFCLSAGILLLAASGLVWVVIHNMESNIIRIKQAEAELLRTYDLTLQGLARVLEFRDSETEGHSRRVVNLSVKLAQVMGCGPEEIEQIKRGALLHDIGKLAIPDHILAKPGPLDHREKKIMERHTVYARDMLAPISFLRQASMISYCHHERWDGSGYPRALKGNEIPMHARLFAVVDQWDALCSERPYRKPWPKEKVIAYLKDNSGKFFDPDVVEAFLKIVGYS